MSQTIDIDHGNDIRRDIYSSELRINNELILEVFEKEGKYFVTIVGLEKSIYTLDYEYFLKSLQTAREAVELPKE